MRKTLALLLLLGGVLQAAPGPLVGTVDGPDFSTPGWWRVKPTTPGTVHHGAILAIQHDGHEVGQARVEYERNGLLVVIPLAALSDTPVAGDTVMLVTDTPTAPASAAAPAGLLGRPFFAPPAMSGDIDCVFKFHTSLDELSQNPRDRITAIDRAILRSPPQQFQAHASAGIAFSDPRLQNSKLEQAREEEFFTELLDLVQHASPGPVEVDLQLRCRFMGTSTHVVDADTYTADKDGHPISFVGRGAQIRSTSSDYLCIIQGFRFQGKTIMLRESGER